MTSPPPNIRLTITVTPETHAAFQRLASSTGISLGRAMGEWLGDTLEAVEFTAGMVEKARSAPALAMREMQAYALGIQDEVGNVANIMRAHGQADREKARSQVIAGGGSGGRAAASSPPSPPSSNTGGKGQGQTRSKGGKVV